MLAVKQTSESAFKTSRCVDLREKQVCTESHHSCPGGQQLANGGLETLASLEKKCFSESYGLIRMLFLRLAQLEKEDTNTSLLSSPSEGNFENVF